MSPTFTVTETCTYEVEVSDEELAELRQDPDVDIFDGDGPIAMMVGDVVGPIDLGDDISFIQVTREVTE